MFIMTHNILCWHQWIQQQVWPTGYHHTCYFGFNFQMLAYGCLMFFQPDISMKFPNSWEIGNFSCYKCLRKLFLHDVGTHLSENSLKPLSDGRFLTRKASIQTASIIIFFLLDIFLQKLLLGLSTATHSFWGWSQIVGIKASSEKNITMEPV